MSRTFLEWVQDLEEAKFKFVVGKDQDYTGDPMEVLVFSEQEPDEYIMQGKTHGQMSHAIKHLREYDPEAVKGVLAKAKKMLWNFLDKNPSYFCKVWSEGRGFSEVSGKKALASCDELVLLNTMDIVNDKNQMKTPFSAVDARLKTFAAELEKKYNSLISSKIDKAVNLEQIKNEHKLLDASQKAKIVHFEAEDRNGGKFLVWIDFTDRTLIIGRQMPKGTVIKTMYRINSAGSTRGSIMKMFFTKKLRISNPMIDAALSSLV